MEQEHPAGDWYELKMTAACAWRHLGAVLESAAMGYSDLVSLRFFLASAADDPANVEILSSHLNGHVAARTVVVQHLLDPR
jgi:enamine deaminase RidA (YjgF/YER057c/UK114 family)